MIVEGKGTNDLLDEPPAYDQVASSSPSSSASAGPSTSGTVSSYFPNDSKLPLPPTRRPIPTPGAGPSSPSTPTPKAPAGWLGQLIGTPQAKQDKEVRQTVLGLVRGVIQQGDGQSSNAIIQCCIDACRARGLSFESIAQERSIQGHTPLYWTIVKIASPSSQPTSATATPATAALPADDPPLDACRALSIFDLLLSFPLTQDAYNDAIQACLLTSSHATFQLVQQRNPNPAPAIPGQEDTSVGGVNLKDEVDVFNGEDVEAAIHGAFRVTVTIKDFQKRVRVLKEVGVDFVARGRMWRLKFFIWLPNMTYPARIEGVPNGAWCVMLDLVENSPDTFLDSRLVIGRRSPEGASKSTTPPRSIAVRLKSSREYQLSGVNGEKKWSTTRGPITHVLSDESNGSSLQFDGCPYVNDDGSLDLLLEAKLVKPGRSAECTFM